MVREVRDNVAAMTEKRNDQLVGWGMAFIGTLIGIIGWLVVHYVIK
jgi:hypothetical protein